MLFYCLLFKVVCIGLDRFHRSIRAVIPHYRQTVNAQGVHGDACADGCIGLGAAQSQASHDVGNGSVVRGRHVEIAVRFYRRLVIHQYQTVTVTGQYIDRARRRQFAVRLACAEDDGGLGHLVVSVQCYIAAVFSRAFGVHGHVLAGQNQTVAGKILYRHTGAHSAAVAFRKGEVFAAIARGADYIGIRRRVDLNILARGDVRPFSQGDDAFIMQFGNIQGSPHRHILAALICRIHRIAANIIIRVAIRTENIRNFVNQELYAFVKGNQVLGFIGEEISEAYGIVGKPGPRLIFFNLSVFQLGLGRNGFRVQVRQFRELFAKFFQRFIQLFQPFRYGLEGFQGIVDLHGLCLQVYAAVGRFQSYALVGFRVALQLHNRIVFNRTVQHAGRHGHLGSGIVVHFVGLARDRVMHTVHMGIGGQSPVHGGNVFAVFFLRGRPRSFQVYPRRHGDVCRVAVIYYRYGSPRRHVFLRCGKSVLQTLQLAAVGHAAQVKLVFD